VIDDNRLRHLLRINDDLLQFCKLLKEKNQAEFSWQLMPIVDKLTHLLADEGRNRMQ
jgi:hypothetical protein